MATRTISTKLAIEGESEYRASLSRINTELKTLQSNLKLTESQYQTSANTVQALKAKHDALTNVIDAQKKKVEELKKALDNAKTAQDTYAQNCATLREKIHANEQAMERLKNAAGDTSKEQKALSEETEKLKKALEEEEAKLAAAEKGVNSWQTQLNNAQVTLNDFSAELEKNDQYLDEAQKSADGCATSIDKFGNEVKESSDATEKQNDALDALAALLAASGIKAGIDKITEALRACIQASSDFEAAMSGVGAIANASTDEMSALNDKAKEIGATTQYTAGQAAEALQYMALAGWSSAEMLEGVDGVINLAAASGENLAEVSDIVTDALTAFGLKAEDSGHFVDVLAKTASSSNTTVGMLGEAFKYAAPLAGALGYSVEDVAVAIGLMANQGIKGSQAGTTLRTMFSKLTGDITLTGQAFGEATVSAANADGTMKPLSQTLDELRGYFNQMTDAEKLANAETLAGKYAMSGLTAIMNSTQADFDSLTETIQYCTGAAKDMADIRMDNLHGQVLLMESAFDALKIAVGDDLNPALRDLSEAGTDVLTWAADFVETHEEIVPIISAVAAALTTLTAGIAGIAIVKTVTPLIVAFNASLAANPAGLVAVAIASLTAALVTFAATMPSVTNEYDTLSAASKNQYDHLQELNGQYEKACELYGENSEQARALAAEIAIQTELYERNKGTIAEVAGKTEELITKNKELHESGREAENSIEKQRASTESLVSHLESLMADEEKTAGTKQEILAVVDLLNESIPELGLAYDEYADSLNLTEANIRKVIEAELEQEKMAAKREELKNSIKEQHDMEAQLVIVRENLAAAEERLGTAIEARNAAIDGRSETELLTMAYNVGGAVDSVVESVITAQNEVDSLRQQEADLTAQMGENQAAIDELTGSFDTLNETSNEATEVSRQTANACSEAAAQLREELETLAAEYQKAYESALNSFDGQFGLWDKAAEVVSNDVSKMIEAQESQSDYWDSYTENLEGLLARNVDGVDRLATRFADGSAESAAALMALANASDEEIGRLISTMDSTDEAKQNLARRFADLETELPSNLDALAAKYEETVKQLNETTETVDFTPFNKAVIDAFSEVGATFVTIGTDAGDGLKEGIETSTDEVTGAADAMAKGVIDALRTVFDSHSPSVVTDGIGQDVGQGLADGITTSKDEVVLPAIEELGSEIVEKLETIGKDSVEHFELEYSALASKVQQHLDEANDAVDAATAGLSQTMECAGEQMVNGMIDGLYNQSGALYSAVASIVNEAIATAQNEAGVHSPSWKTEKIFENVGEGMIVGIEAKRQKVRSATADVVNSALMISPDAIKELSRSVSSSIPDLSSLLESRNERVYANGASGGSDAVRKSSNYHIEMQITTQPGQNNKEIAEYVMDLMQQELERKGGAF